MKNPFDFRSDEQIAKDMIAAATVQLEEFVRQAALPKTASNHSTETNALVGAKNKVINQGW